jgi:hypothetical protein
MLCFRDITFCASDCGNTACKLRFGPDQEAAALKWWGKPGAPVAFWDHSTDCEDYVPPPGAHVATIMKEAAGR